MDLESVLSILTAVGFGGIFGAWAKSKLDKQAEIEKKLIDINEEKYRGILMYMSFVLDQTNTRHFMMNDPILNKLEGPEIKEYAISKLKEYTYHSLLFASDDVVQSLRTFIKEPTRENFLKSAICMRHHLWNEKTKLQVSELIDI